MTSQTYRGEVDIVNHHSILRELAILRTIMQQQEKERRKKKERKKDDEDEEGHHKVSLAERRCFCETKPSLTKGSIGFGKNHQSMK